MRVVILDHCRTSRKCLGGLLWVVEEMDAYEEIFRKKWLLCAEMFYFVCVIVLICVGEQIFPGLMNWGEGKIYTGVKWNNKLNIT